MVMLLQMTILNGNTYHKRIHATLKRAFQDLFSKTHISIDAIPCHLPELQLIIHVLDQSDMFISITEMAED
jgi:hypothetical protein